MAEFRGLSEFEESFKLRTQKIQIIILKYTPERNCNISEFGDRQAFLGVDVVSQAIIVSLKFVFG